MKKTLFTVIFILLGLALSPAIALFAQIPVTTTTIPTPPVTPETTSGIVTWLTSQSLDQWTNWLKMLVEVVSQIVFGLTIIATALVKLVPKLKPTLDLASSKFYKFLTWLPLFGFSPRTQKLEEALKDLQAQVEKK